MQNFKPPTPEDLRAYQVLISFLMQVRLLLQEVNEETERSIELLREQRREIHEQDSALLDFTLNLHNCERDAEHLFQVLREGNAALEAQEELMDKLNSGGA